MPRLLVVIASTRPGRVGLPVADWFVEQARAHDRFHVDVADLKELDLPMMDEAKHPRLGEYELDHTKAWAGTVFSADAFVFVTPEYNHSYTAPLKNAIDYLHAEWQRKPVGFVSYGGVAAGTRAVQALKPVLLAVKALPVTEAVNLPLVGQHVKDGVFTGQDIANEAAVTMLDELLRVEAALRPLRAAAA